LPIYPKRPICSILQVRDYPWGDGKRSLFHHEKYNPVPGEGYSWMKTEEDEE
jgi:hypothetical protein